MGGMCAPWLFLAPLLALFLSACPAEEAPPAAGCAGDADCPTGQLCVGGSCREGDGGGGSGGGGEPPQDECAGSDDCIDRPFPNVPSIYWDGEAGFADACTVPRRSCPGNVACQVPTECRPVSASAVPS